VITFTISPHKRHLVNIASGVTSPHIAKVTTLFFYYPPFASIAKGEVFVLLYVCFSVFLFVRSTISQQPAGRFTPYFACGRSVGRDVSSPLLGVGGPRRAEKEANEIFVTMESMGNFLHFGGF